MDESDRMAAVTGELAAAGVPRWAVYDPDGLGTARVYAWVDDDGEIRCAIVGDLGTGVASDLIRACDRMLDGEEDRRPGAEPTDLEQPTALVLIQSGGGVGHGRLSRAPLRPLRAVVLGARAELARLT